MTKTIAELWCGNIDPISRSGRNNEKLKSLEKLITRNSDKLSESLDQKQRELFEKYNDCMDEYLFNSCEQAFCDGFSLGARILAEALIGTDDIDLI